MKIDNTPSELLNFIVMDETLDLRLREAAARVYLYCNDPVRYARVLMEEQSEQMARGEPESIKPIGDYNDE